MDQKDFIGKNISFVVTFNVPIRTFTFDIDPTSNITNMRKIDLTTFQHFPLNILMIKWKTKSAKKSY